MSVLVVTNSLQFKNSPVKVYDISTPQNRAKAFVHAFMDIYGHGGIDLLVGKVGDDDWGVCADMFYRLEDAGHDAWKLISETDPHLSLAEELVNRQSVYDRDATIARFMITEMTQLD